ncbi:hypothetical protein, conserved [Eimeria brunetti]|uniref:Uncharacterized protein n=1 Tax=Eimeria brunetti TaxID=51314 RepID=U6LMA4_9EIME|nr:hypothetical protein, conserved [Eimeria brunetti]
MSLEAGTGSCNSNAMVEVARTPAENVRGRSEDSVGHLLEPVSFPPAANSTDLGGFTSASDSAKKAAFISGLSEQLAALAALFRPTRTSNERDPPESLSAGHTLLPIQQKGHPLKYLTLAAGLLTGFWGWRAARSIERVVARRYADIAYQIRRPDALSARITAFKFLVLGGLVLPGSAVAFASLQLRAPQLAGQPGDSHLDALEGPSTGCGSRRTVLAEVLPITLQVDVRRLVSSLPVRQRSSQQICVTVATVGTGGLLSGGSAFLHLTTQVAAFHTGLSEFIGAVAPSREKWVQWAAGARTSHVAGLQRPSALSSRIATWDSSDANE